MRLQDYKKVALFLGLIFLFSCVEDQEFLALKNKVYTLDVRVGRLEKEIKNLKKKVGSLEETSTGKASLIYKELEEVKGAISENAERMDTQYRDILGRVEKLEDEIKEIKWDISLLKSVKESISMANETVNATFTPSSNKTFTPEELYSMALDAYRRGDVQEARKLFNEYLSKYPNTDLSDNALFWIGETYYVEGRYPEAIVRYQEVLVKFPKGDKVPSALLKMALSQIKLGALVDARVTLERLIKEFPNTPQARIAERELRKLGQ